MSDCRTRWWIGLTCDHIYPDCPNRTRAEKTLRESDGADVCGLCLHRHDRTMHKGAAP